MAGPANSHDNSVCNPKLAVEAIKSGAIDYLSKPYAPEELLHAVGAARSASGYCRKTRACARGGESYSWIKS